MFLPNFSRYFLSLCRYSAILFAECASDCVQYLHTRLAIFVGGDGTVSLALFFQEHGCRLDLLPQHILGSRM